jgi:hypothetical protein
MANVTRLAIDTALLKQLAAAQIASSPPAAAFVSASMHFRQWSDVDAQQQPCLFLLRIVEDDDQQKAYGLNKYEFKYEAWIYARVDFQNLQANPYCVLDPLIDAVDAAVKASPLIGRNNLGGIVDNCRIKGSTVIADGADDGQAVIRIPISVFTGI